jgi:hypothetical protein
MEYRNENGIMAIAWRNGMASENNGEISIRNGGRRLWRNRRAMAAWRRQWRRGVS